MEEIIFPVEPLRLVITVSPVTKGAMHSGGEKRTVCRDVD